MDENIWTDFGDNLRRVKDFNYFPSKWIEGDSVECFIDYAEKYREDFYDGKDFFDFFPKSKLEKNFTGFLNIPKKEIKLFGDFFNADFIFVDSGKIKYAQKDFGDDGFSIKKVQSFFYENFVLDKMYYLGRDQIDEEDGFYEEDMDEKDLIYFERFFEKRENFEEEFFIPKDYSIPLSYVSRSFKFDLKNGLISRYIQWSKSNSEVFLYPKGKEKALGFFTFDSLKDFSHIYYMDQINSNPYILKDFEKLRKLFFNLDFFPNNLSFKTFKEFDSKLVKESFLK